MKFKFYLIFLLTISALISCSKDDDPGDKIPDMSPDATFSLAIENPMTKTLSQGAVDPKDRITKLSVIVFIGDQYYTMKDSILPVANLERPENYTVDQVRDIAVKSGNVKILVLANAENSAEFVNKSFAEALEIKTEGLADETHNALTMSSGIISTTLGVSVHNYLGYDKLEVEGIKVCSRKPVELYRNVARIQLSSLKLQKMTDYGEAVSFKLKKIYIVNAKSHSYLASNENWGTVEVASDNSDGFWWQGTKGTKGEYNRDTYDYSVENKTLEYNFETFNSWTDLKYYDENTAEIEPMNDITLGFTDALTDICDNVQDKVVFPIGNFFYVYENMTATFGSQTMLVLQGDYTYIPKGGTLQTVENTYYSVIINENGKDNSMSDGLTVHNGIKRNTKYSLQLTILGQGSPTPDPDSRAYLGAKVKVNKWGVIEISEKVD